jgi:hypothetical protein
LSETKKQIVESRPTPVATDTLNKLLDKAIIADSIEFDNYPPFLYFKSGNFVTATQKNSIIIYIPDDSTFTIEFYSLSDGKWQKNSELKNIEAEIVAFNSDYKDFNFDGFNDLYIQQNASNGYVMSRGYLITINPKTKELTLHNEVRDEANLTPDAKTKTVYADELVECKKTTFMDVCKRAFKWSGQKLVKKDRTCPCTPLEY